MALASLELGADSAVPGEAVSFHGRYYNDAQPVILRLGSLDGPVLATVPPDGLVDFRHSFWREITGSFALPAEVQPGTHIVLATQEDAAGKPTWGVPARASINVAGQGGPTAALPPTRSPTIRQLSELEVRSGRTNVLVPILLGLAGALLGAMAASALSRRRIAPGSASSG